MMDEEKNEMNGENEDKVDEDGKDGEDELFEIPVLPKGRVLEIQLLSNWGDSTHIGLNSIEIFTDNGQKAVINKITSNAEEYTGNIESLLTESLICKDAEKMWSANMITHGNDSPIMIRLEMEEDTCLAMIRFWNYNASRVKAQIGVKSIQMVFDGVIIFKGEIDCSFSTDAEFEVQMGDTILFTTDDMILEQISHHDICLVPEQLNTTTMMTTLEVCDQLTPYRPSTCETKEVYTPVDVLDTPKYPTQKISGIKKDVKMMHIEISSNWGMRGMIGLTGIEIVNENNQIIDESQFTLTTSCGSLEMAKRLFNGKNLTRNSEDMWLIEFNEKEKTTLSFTFHTAHNLKAVSIWNYNSNFELSYAGAKCINIYINGKLTMHNILLRKATGFVYFDYVQDILLDPLSVINPTRPMTTTIGGFVFQIRLLSTWGDEFYIGLNGVELFDRKGNLIPVKEQNLAAFPESVNILPQIKNDMRTSDKLIDGFNDTNEARHMWLTPLLPNRCARVFFVFDEPTYISKMVIYNYRKTPERGVRHVSVSVDDLIVFSGELAASSDEATARLEIDLHNL